MGFLWKSKSPYFTYKINCICRCFKWKEWIKVIYSNSRLKLFSTGEDKKLVEYDVHGST